MCVQMEAEKSVNGLSGKGRNLAVNFQVVAFDWRQISVSKELPTRYRFGKVAGTVTHGTTGRVTLFTKQVGVHVIKIWFLRARQQAKLTKAVRSVGRKQEALQAGGGHELVQGGGGG